MKNILLIGLGRFGRHVAIQLNNLGHEVMAVDNNEERVNEVLPFVTNAQIGDSTNADFLKSLGIGNFDVCMVTIGGNFQNSLETTSCSKNSVQKRLYRVQNGMYRKISSAKRCRRSCLSGKQIAEWAAIRYTADHIRDYIQVDEAHAIFEVEVPENWISKTIGQLDIRKNSESILLPSGKTTKLIWQFLQIPYSSLVPHCLFSVNIKNFKNVSVCSFYFHNRFHRF